MAGLKRRGQELTIEELEVVVYWKRLGFVMEVFHRCRAMAARNDSKAVVLHRLDFSEMRRLQIWRINGSCEFRDGESQRFIRQEHIFRGTAPIRARQGLWNLETRPHLVYNLLGMRAEGEVKS